MKRRFKPVFLLKNALKKYRQIEQKGGWKTIIINNNIKSFDLVTVAIRLRR
jgi:hypothetical protein